MREGFSRYTHLYDEQWKQAAFDLFSAANNPKPEAGKNGARGQEGHSTATAPRSRRFYARIDGPNQPWLEQQGEATQGRSRLLERP
ncbi:hypothetical protein [Calidithermus chliarophilus]|uniref:hypothetical protein n=1 Tax=Calidithermus chliarophilus TaxID=52023 RepID=UPI000401CC9C|nr:hypothetical protein [Calidithermus chliarophilus]